MLGFAPLGAGPLGISTTGIAGVVILATVGAVSAAGTTNETASANHTPSAVTSTTSSSAPTLQGKANETVASISPTLSSGDLSFVGLANHSISSVNGTYGLNSVAFTANASITSGTALGTVEQNTDTISGVQFGVFQHPDPTGVSSTISAGTAGFDAQGGAVNGGVTATISHNDISAKGFAYTTADQMDGPIGIGFLGGDPNGLIAEANHTPTGVQAGFSINIVYALLRAATSLDLGSVVGVSKVKLVAPADNLFDYEQYADDYARTRTVYIQQFQFDRHHTIYIPQGESTTIMVEPRDQADTVFIQAENTTVYILPHQDLPTTVLITT